MSKITLICPNCRSPLKVTTRHLGRKGRCPECRNVFLLRKKYLRPSGRINDDDVLTWLGPASPVDADDEPIESPARAPGATEATGGENQGGPAEAKPPETPIKPTPAKRPAPPQPVVQAEGRFNVAVDHVDAMGAFFRFDPRLLADDAFRCSFPQRCVLCGSKHDLSVYPVVWSCKLEKARKSDQPDQTPYVLKLADLDAAKGRDLLARMREVKYVPEPYCLPFPYYVCSSCSPVGAVMTHVHQQYPANRQEQLVEVCELGISSLAAAERFARRACGPETEAVARIRQARSECLTDQWQALPLAVRNRINQWYQAQPDETFLGYVSDADFAKAEAGTAGIVVTDKRLVYRKSVARVELDRAGRISVEQAPARDGHTLLILRDAEGQEARMMADSSCLGHIRNLVNGHHAGAQQAAEARSG